MAYTTINKGSDYFNTVLYTGTGSATSITGVGFQPDWVWIKRRNDTGSHRLVDAVRGATNYLESDTTDAEGSTGNVSSFDSDGFSHSAGGLAYNASGSTYASWNWLAANGTSANTDGDISSTVSANTTAGFSIVSYTGSGTASDTVGHGLGVTPAMIIVKNRTEATSWCVTHKSLTTDKVLRLDGTNAEGDIGDGELDSPPNNSSTFGFNNGTSGTPLKVVNESSDNYIAYCFAEKKGFSKFGSYTGNGNADGPFVYTGFKPAFVIGKITSDLNEWFMMDSKRDTFNVANKSVYANTSGAENTNHNVDFLSNGFKLRDSDGTVNLNNGSYIYMAFAEHPLVSSTGTPVTAR